MGGRVKREGGGEVRSSKCEEHETPLKTDAALRLRLRDPHFGLVGSAVDLH